MVEHYKAGRRGDEPFTYRNFDLWKVGIGTGAWLATMDEGHEVTEDEISAAIASLERQWPRPPHLDGAQPHERIARHHIGPEKVAA